MYASVEFAAQIVVGLQQDLEAARQVFFGELLGGAGESGTLIGSCRDQFGIGSAHPGDQQVPHVPDGFAAEMLQIAAFPLKRVDESERAVGGTCSNRGN